VKRVSVPSAHAVRHTLLHTRRATLLQFEAAAASAASMRKLLGTDRTFENAPLRAAKPQVCDSLPPHYLLITSSLPPHHGYLAGETAGV
jgi:hypothetical protein